MGPRLRGATESALRRLVLVAAALAFRAGKNLLGDEAGILADRRFDLGGDVRVALEEAFGVLAALADALGVIGEPRARLLDHAGLDAEIENLAALGDALAVHDVEFDLLERRRQLVLDHLDAGLVRSEERRVGKECSSRWWTYHANIR